MEKSRRSVLAHAVDYEEGHSEAVEALVDGYLKDDGDYDRFRDKNADRLYVGN